MLNNLLYSKSNKYMFFLSVLFLFILLITLILFILKKEDVTILKGIVKYDNNTQIVFNLDDEEATKLTNNKAIFINDEKYTYEVISIGELQYEYATMTNYQEFKISIKSKEFKNNQIVDTRLYTNRERIIKKIIKKIIGKD